MFNQENFFKNTTVDFKGCKKPKRPPDYISYSKSFIDYIKYVNKVTKNKFKIKTPRDYRHNECRLKNYDLLSLEEWRLSPLSNVRVSSMYWYGTNSKGSYVIRSSDHWSSFKGFNKLRGLKGCGKIVECYWRLKTNSNKRIKVGKAYFKNFKEV